MKPTNNRFALWLMLLGLPWVSRAALLQLDTNASQIEVAVKSTSASFVGKLQKYQAKIEWNPGQPLPARAELTFDFDDLKTGSKGRDQHMLEWLQYSKEPTASFRLKSWETGNDSEAMGELTIHGVHKSIRIPVAVKRNKEGCEIDGSVTLDYREFGLPLIRKALLFTVDPHLTVRFHLVGKGPSE